MTIHRPACGSALHSLQPADVFGGVRVPHRAGVLQSWPDEGFVGTLLDGDGANSQVSTEEAKSLIGFVGDVANVGVPTTELYK